MPTFNPVVQGIQGKVTEPEYVDTRLNLDLSGLKNLGNALTSYKIDEAEYEAKIAKATKDSKRDALDLQLKLNREQRAQESHEWAREKFNFAVNAEARNQAKFGVYMEEAERKKYDWEFKQASDIALKDYSEATAQLQEKALQNGMDLSELNTQQLKLKDDFYKKYNYNGRPILGYDEMAKIDRGYSGLSVSDAGYYQQQYRQSLEEEKANAKANEKRIITSMRENAPTATRNMSDSDLLKINDNIERNTRQIQYINALQDQISGPVSPELEIARNNSYKNLGVQAATMASLETISKNGYVNPVDLEALKSMTINEMEGNGLNVTEATVTTNKLFDVLGLAESGVRFEEKQRALETMSTEAALTRMVIDNVDPVMLESFKRYYRTDVSPQEKVALLDDIVKNNKYGEFSKFTNVLTTTKEDIKRALIEGDPAYKNALEFNVLKVKGGTSNKEDEIAAAAGIAISSTIGSDDIVNTNNYKESEIITTNAVENHIQDMTPEEKEKLSETTKEATAAELVRVENKAKESGKELRYDTKGYVVQVDSKDGNAITRMSESAFGGDVNNRISTINRNANNIGKLSSNLNPDLTEEEARKQYFESIGIQPLAENEQISEARPGFIAGLRSGATAVWETTKALAKHPRLAKMAGAYLLSSDENRKQKILQDAVKYYNNLSTEEQRDLDNSIRIGTQAREDVGKNEEFVSAYGFGQISGHPILSALGATAFDMLPKDVKQYLYDSTLTNWIGDIANKVAGDPTYGMSNEDRASFLTFASKLHKYKPEEYEELNKGFFNGLLGFWKEHKKDLSMNVLKNINSKKEMTKLYANLVKLDFTEDEKLFDYLKEKGIEQPIINPNKITNLEDKKLIANAIVSGVWNDETLEVLNKYK